MSSKSAQITRTENFLHFVIIFDFSGKPLSKHVFMSAHLSTFAKKSKNVGLLSISTADHSSKIHIPTPSHGP